ncbi:MAG: MFS transporter [Microthrixaceae bacterium]
MSVSGRTTKPHFNASARPGSIHSALQSTAFRRIFAGTFASNVGTWMQNITLIALAYQLTKNAWFTGVITFAQLGPMLIISPFGGALADRVSRKVLIVSMSAVQMTMSVVLAVVALSDAPNQVVLVLVVAMIGIASAINGPTMNALLPELVPRDDLQPAIALNSVSMNSSRVLGPLLGGAVGAVLGSSSVFFINGLTYLFVIWAVSTVDVDFSPKGSSHDGPIKAVVEGFRAAKQDPLILRVLITIAVYSFCSLIFIYQMPLLAERHLGLSGWRFNLLFAAFALGAAGGALAMGSILSAFRRSRMTRWGSHLLRRDARCVRDHHESRCGVRVRLPSGCRILRRRHSALDHNPAGGQGFRPRSHHGTVDDGVGRTCTARRPDRGTDHRFHKYYGGSDLRRSGRCHPRHRHGPDRARLRRPGSGSHVAPDQTAPAVRRSTNCGSAG